MTTLEQAFDTARMQIAQTLEVDNASPAKPLALQVGTRDGSQLHLDGYGDATHPTVLMSHGFGQSRLAWRNAAQSLASSGFNCLAADSRGHGLSSWNDETPYSIDQLVSDAKRLAGCTGAGKPIWVGASMGGLIGMVAEAETVGGLFSALVLVDITPRWEEAGVSRIIEFMRAHPDGFATVDEARDAVLNYLPHRAERASSERLRQMLVMHRDGRLRWHWDPRLLNDIGADSSQYEERLHDAARALQLPVLLISGSQSDVVSEKTIAEFMHLVPHAQHVVIEGATHMVVGDDNHAFTDAVRTFILGQARKEVGAESELAAASP